MAARARRQFCFFRTLGCDGPSLNSGINAMAAAIRSTGSAPRIVVHASIMWRLSGRNRPANHAAVLLRRGGVRHVSPADADEPFRSAQNVGARAPRGCGPMLGQQLARLVEKNCSALRSRGGRAQSRPCNDRAGRSSPAGRCARPRAQPARASASVPPAWAMAGAKSCRTWPLFPRTEMPERRRTCVVSTTWVGRSKAKAKKGWRMPASIFGRARYKFSVSPRPKIRRGRYCASR
jgi:hypothetical protein